MPAQKSRKVTVEFDLGRLRTLADALGFYHPKFLEDIEASDADIRAGRTRKVTSSKDLR